MIQIKHLDKFRVPLTGQEIELQQIDHEGGGMSQIRIRVRERTRFTTVDLDPVTARHWGEALRRWADRGDSKTPLARACCARNPNPEYRDPKEIRIPKSDKWRGSRSVFGLRISRALDF